AHQLQLSSNLSDNSSSSTSSAAKMYVTAWGSSIGVADFDSVVALLDSTIAEFTLAGPGTLLKLVPVDCANIGAATGSAELALVSSTADGAASTASASGTAAGA